MRVDRSSLVGFVVGMAVGRVVGNRVEGFDGRGECWDMVGL